MPADDQLLGRAYVRSGEGGIASVLEVWVLGIPGVKVGGVYTFILPKWGEFLIIHQEPLHMGPQELRRWLHF